jgi:hypothetical protein
MYTKSLIPKLMLLLNEEKYMKMWRSQLDLNYIGNTKHWCEDKTRGWLLLDQHHKIEKRKKTLILCNVCFFGLQSCDVVEMEINIFFLQNLTQMWFFKKELVTYSLFFDKIKILKKEKCQKKIHNISRNFNLNFSNLGAFF